MPAISKLSVVAACAALSCLCLADEPKPRGLRPSTFPALPAAISEPAPSNPTTTAERIERALVARSPLEVRDMTLGDLAQHLSDTYGIPVVLDGKSIREGGDPDDVRFTFAMRHQSLGVALGAMLSQHDLEYAIDGDVLLITSHERVGDYLSTKVYDVRDLLEHGRSRSADFDNLIQLCTSIVAPPSWTEVGGTGSIKNFRQSLVISQTFENHQQVRDFLASLRRGLRMRAAGRRSASGMASDAPEDDAVHAALGKTVSWHFDKMPLDDFAAMLRRDFNIDVLLDRQQLRDKTNDGGKLGEFAVSAHLSNVRLGTALTEALRPVSLGWGVRDNFLVLTTDDWDHTYLTSRAYLVADLVEWRGKSDDAEVVVYADGSLDPRCDFDSMIQLITSTVSPTSWTEVGGTGSIKEFEFGRLIVLNQHESVHRRVDELLADIRRHDGSISSTADGGRIGAADANAMRAKIYKLDYGLDESVTARTGRRDEAEVTRMIRTLIEPASWSADPEAQIYSLRGQIVVRHRETVHRRIHRLLTDLDVMAWPPEPENDAREETPRDAAEPDANAAKSDSPGTGAPF